MLSWDAEKIMSEEEFFDCCEATVTEKDFHLLTQARLSLSGEREDVISDSILNKWISWETSLRNELVKMRASKKGVDGEKYISSSAFEAGVTEIAREAFGASSPLDAEIVIDKARWDFLEMLEAEHQFDTGKLIIYFLQLQILHRRAQIEREKGKKAFQDIYSHITGKADN